MNSKSEKIVMLLVAVSLIMLISVQVYWARRSYAEAETVYNENVRKVITVVRDEANDAVTCFTLYSKTYVDTNEGIFLMKSKWHGDEVWDSNGDHDSVSMFFNVPEEYKNSKLNRIYKDLKFSTPVTAEILLKFRYDMTMNSPDKSILSQNINVNNFKDAIKNHEPLLAVYDTLMIDSLLKLRLKESNMDLKYSYALVNSKNDSVMFNSNRAVTKAMLKDGVRMPFTPNDLFSYPFDIILLAKNKSLIILGSILTVLLLSVGIIIILLFAFIFFIRVINRQKKLSEMKNDFINNLTHEFNTPIANISLASETLWENGKIIKDAYSERTFEIIKSETNHLKENVSRILKISAFEEKESGMKCEEINLADIISCSINRLTLKINRRSANVSFVPHSSAIINGDKTHLAGAIENLIDNALKYSNGNCKINIELFNTNNSKVISISDNGIGMSKDEMSKIFDKFYRVQHGNIQNERGFGLGLNYVKQVIESHGGSISVSSKQGEGSCFRITFNGDEKKSNHTTG